MHWNWQLEKWPHFIYDATLILPQERKFLLGAGSTAAFLKNIDPSDYQTFVVEILSQEGVESAKIEGEILDRSSVQSSIKRHFGLEIVGHKERRKESQMANLLWDMYQNFDQPITHEMLWRWHAALLRGDSRVSDLGTYRTHEEPMQIVSHRYDAPKVFFEAPPSKRVFSEMEAFVRWCQLTQGSGSILGRAAMAHVYFESIHPFEDGNGRIGRALVEKILSHEVGRPLLLSVSKTLEKRKKEYYSELEKCNTTLEISSWVQFFADVVVQAQEESMALVRFLLKKSQILGALELNPRQEKALIRMYQEGPDGFTGGLSSEKYIAITKASRATATRDLADLVQKGALVKTGELRHTRYWLHT